MALSKLQFRSGVNKETTSYSNEGGWFDANLVRFKAGRPQKIGGWRKDTNNSFLGTCRALHPWFALNGSKFLGLGTHLKYLFEILAMLAIGALFVVTSKGVTKMPIQTA